VALNRVGIELVQIDLNLEDELAALASTLSTGKMKGRSGLMADG
jgi:hypothetical protein